MHIDFHRINHIEVTLTKMQNNKKKIFENFNFKKRSFSIVRVSLSVRPYVCTTQLGIFVNLG